MGHPADSEQPRYTAADIQIFQAHEAIRMRPTMYFGSTDRQALPRLLQLAVEGVLWHYRFLEEAPDQMTIHLASDGSATVISSKAAASFVFLEQSTRLLREECSHISVQRARSFLPLRGANSLSELFVVNALSEHFRVGIRQGEKHWRSFLFQQGVFLHDEELSPLPDPEYDIQVHFCPDFTILGPATWDPKQAQKAMDALSRDFPSVPLTVIDPR